MGNTATLVDDIVKDHEGVDPAAVDATATRALIVRVAQRALDYIWNVRNWTFRSAEATVSCTSGLGYLPTDFLRIGQHGGVYIPASRRILQWVPLLQMEQLRLQEGDTGSANLYSVGGTVSLADQTNYGKRKLFIYPKETVTVTIAYERAAPTLVDGGHTGETITDGLLELPDPFYTAVYEQVVFKRMIEKGNASQTAEQKMVAVEALADLIRIEQQGMEAAHCIVPYRGRNL